MSQWLFTLSATDANRTALRIARQVTGRGKVLVLSYCYHGSVDESFAVRRPDGSTASRAGNVGGGIPCGALGLTGEVYEALQAQPEADYEDTGGVGGTLADNPLSVAAMRATLSDVLTADAYARMIPLGPVTRWADVDRHTEVFAEAVQDLLAQS